jgi:release factor glutamine methyltransferase
LGLTIADIGTGSGCIAIVLAKKIPHATFFAVDPAAPALQVARQNAKIHQVAEKISFLQGSLLAPLHQAVGMIVSNPPYVSRPELRSAMPEVSQYEPALALDGGEDGLDLIRALLAQARQKLVAGGYLLVEIGASQGRAVTELTRRYFPTGQVELTQDLAGWDRLLVIKSENV